MNTDENTRKYTYHRGSDLIQWSSYIIYNETISSGVSGFSLIIMEKYFFNDLLILISKATEFVWIIGHVFFGILHQNIYIQFL